MEVLFYIISPFVIYSIDICIDSSVCCSKLENYSMLLKYNGFVTTLLQSTYVDTITGKIYIFLGDLNY